MGKIVVLLLTVLAFQSVMAFNLIDENQPNDDRVKVDYFFESLCPYCQQFIVGALKTAANTKVSLMWFRISGRYATSISIPTETPNVLLMVQVGVSHASMEFANAKEILLRPALFVFMT